MPSLKGFNEHLGSLLGVSSVALYERQRAFVRAGIMTSKPGRGPGSGVEATPHNVAILILSVLSTDSLSEAVKCAEVFVNAQPITHEIGWSAVQHDDPCPVSNSLNPIDTLAFHLGPNANSRVLKTVMYNRRWESISFIYNQNLINGGADQNAELDQPDYQLHYGLTENRKFKYPELEFLVSYLFTIKARIDGDLIIAIGSALKHFPIIKYR